jgi:hypothetical protein
VVELKRSLLNSDLSLTIRFDPRYIASAATAVSSGFQAPCHIIISDLNRCKAEKFDKYVVNVPQ